MILTMSRLRVHYWVFFILALFIFLLDQATKLFVASSIPFGTYKNPIPFISDWVYWVHVGNTGVAWSLFEGIPSFFAFLGLVFLGAVFLFRKQLELSKPWMQWAFGLMCGGILGNIVDRFAHGYVVDFIDVHLPGYRYPSFNVADISIFCGVLIYSIFSFWPSHKKENLPKLEKQSPQGAKTD